MITGCVTVPAAKQFAVSQTMLNLSPRLRVQYQASVFRLQLEENYRPSKPVHRGVRVLEIQGQSSIIINELFVAVRDIEFL